MDPSTPVTRTLDQLAVPYQLHLHATQLRSLEQAAEERELDPGQIVRSLLFRLEDGSFIMVLMSGPTKVAWPKLRHHLGISRMTTASAEEVREVTGYETGAVSPYGLPQPLPLLADQRILNFEVISIGAGIRNAGVIMRRDDLIRTLRPELGDFSGE
jgi:Cys-tRNA(Pro) deacylase